MSYLDKERRIKMKKFLPLAILLISAAAIGYAVYYTDTKTDRGAVENGLRETEPIVLTVIFLSMLALFALNFRNIKEHFKKISRGTWIILLSIFILAVFLRAFAAPQTHRVYFDEDIYLDIGKEILVNGKAALCNYGEPCREYAFMKWPNGYPFLLAISYMFFGASEGVGFGLVTLLGSLSVVLIFLLSYVFSKNEKISLFAALLFSLIPIHIMWSATAAAEPVLVFFSLLAISFFSLAAKSDSLKMYALAIAALAYAMQTKTEGVLLLPVAALLVILFDKNLLKKLSSYRFCFLWIALFVLIAPFLTHIFYAFLYDQFGSSGDKFSLDHAAKNVPENLGFWVFGYPTIEHPVLFTIFALMGIGYLAKKERRLLLFLGVWFFSFFSLYSFFYAGSVRFGVDVRYILSNYVPFAIAAGFGVLSASQSLGRIAPLLKDKSFMVAAALIIISFLFYLPSISTPTEKIEEARQARTYHKFVLDNMPSLKGCYVMSHVSSIYLMYGVNSLQTWNVNNKERMDTLLQGCVIFDDGFWCNIEPYKTSVCRDTFEGKFNITQLTAIKVDNHDYAFFRVSQK
ncbi:MAG: glycosyltransferase family 39 protein [Candidatus Aenigmarchaeota archaeon]|nr:glycosyltransferase family 39 protein [Candidatus Aenigmarchaeota archaeon]